MNRKLKSALEHESCVSFNQVLRTASRRFVPTYLNPNQPYHTRLHPPHPASEPMTIFKYFKNSLTCISFDMHFYLTV